MAKFEAIFVGRQFRAIGVFYRIYFEFEADENSTEEQLKEAFFNSDYSSAYECNNIISINKK